MPQPEPSKFEQVCRLGFQIEMFSDFHVRLADCVDVWPTTQRYRPTGSNNPAGRYRDLADLKVIVEKELSQRKPKPKQLPLAGTTPSQPAKRPIVQITMEEWKRKFE